MSDRAKQFMPFAALKGYYDFIYEREKISTPRKELSEDDCAALSAKISAIKKGDLLTVTFYDEGAYVRQCGMVSRIDFTFRRLTIVKTDIDFDDIYDVEHME